MNSYALLIDVAAGLSANTRMSGQLIWAGRVSLVLSRIRTAECCVRDYGVVHSVVLCLAKHLFSHEEVEDHFEGQLAKKY